MIIYITTSLDGFIVDTNDGVDWFPHLKDDFKLEAIDYKSLMFRIDTILIARQSYKQIYLFTSKQLETDKPYISITHNNLLEFVFSLKDRKSDKYIWLLCGAQRAQSFLPGRVIDKIILTIVPQTLGEGIITVM